MGWELLEIDRGRPDLVRVLVSACERLDRVPVRRVPIRQVEAKTWDTGHMRSQLAAFSDANSPTHPCL